MKTINKVIFIENEKKAMRDVIKGEISLRQASKILKCSYEQVRLLLGKILIQGYREGWIKIDFNKL